jgi:hypothetical protein
MTFVGLSDRARLIYGERSGARLFLQRAHASSFQTKIGPLT